MENNPNCVDFSKNKSFDIQQLTRLREDKCFIDVFDKTTEKPGDYTTSNHNDCECEAEDEELAIRDKSARAKHSII